MAVKQPNLWKPGFTNAPPFLQFWKKNWMHILSQLCCLVVALVAYLLCPPLWPRFFPVFPGVETSSWGVKYSQSFRPEYFNSWHMAVLAYAVPALVMGAFSLWGIRDFFVGNAALTGLGYALSTSTLFINLVKIFVGGLRPHFLTLCEPMVINYPPGTPPHYYTAEHICMGDESLLKEAQMSFPSGHACAAFAGFVFLAFFLNAQLKTFGFGRTLGFCQPHDGGSGIIAHWKLLAFILPWCCATILAASKVRDGWHHPIDVVVGAMVGTAFATMAYAMSYRSVWDPATNHIPW